MLVLFLAKSKKCPQGSVFFMFVDFSGEGGGTDPQSHKPSRDL